MDRITILKLLTGAQLTGLAGMQHLCCGLLEIPGSGGKTVSAGDRDKRDDWYKQGAVWHGDNEFGLKQWRRGCQQHIQIKVKISARVREENLRFRS